MQYSPESLNFYLTGISKSMWKLIACNFYGYISEILKIEIANSCNQKLISTKTQQFNQIDIE